MRTSPSNHTLVARSLSVAAIATDTTTNGAGVGLGAYASAMVVVFTGTITDGTFTVEVQDSNDNSSFAAVADVYLEGAEPVLGGADDNTVTVIGYRGSKKYLRVSVVSADTTTGGVLGALVVLADPSRSPVVR